MKRIICGPLTILWSLWLCSCAYTFDDNAPDVVMQDDPPPTPGPWIKKANNEGFSLVRAKDGSDWILFYPEDSEQFSPSFPANFGANSTGLAANPVRLCHLSSPPIEIDLANALFLPGTDLDLWVQTDGSDPSAPMPVTILTVGDTGKGTTLELPVGTILNSNAILDDPDSITVDALPGALYVFEKNGALRRTILPRSASHKFGWTFSLIHRFGGFLLTAGRCLSGGSPLYCERITAHSIIAAQDFVLGDFSGVAAFDTAALISCEPGGLREVPYDGQPARRIDTTPCDPENSKVWVLPSQILTCDKLGLLSHRRDGSGVQVVDSAPCAELTWILDEAAYYPDDVYATQPGTWAQTRAGQSSLASFLCGDGRLLQVPGNDDPVTYLPGVNCAHDVALLDSSVLSCDDTGLRLTAYDGSPQRILDASCGRIVAIGEQLVPTSTVGGAAPYLVDGEVAYERQEPAIFAGSGPRPPQPQYAVPLNGSAPPRLTVGVEPPTRILRVDPLGPTLYAFDSPNYFLNDASDGWIEDRQFMTRGINPAFGVYRRELYWLENAARTIPVGDLEAAPLAGGPVAHLARNVARFQEIAPGVLLVADNQAYAGPQNRIILVDEDRRTSRLLVDNAVFFYFGSPISDGEHPMVLVERVTDTGTEIAEVPLPSLR